MHEQSEQVDIKWEWVFSVKEHLWIIWGFPQFFFEKDVSVPDWNVFLEQELFQP